MVDKTVIIWLGCLSMALADDWEKEDSDETDEPNEWVLEELGDPDPSDVELPQLEWYGGVAVGPHWYRGLSYDDDTGYPVSTYLSSEMGFNVELGYKFESGFITDLRVRYDTDDYMLFAYSVGYQVYSDDKFIVLPSLSFNYLNDRIFCCGNVIGTVGAEVELLYRRVEMSKNHLSLSFGTFLGDPYEMIQMLENSYYYSNNEITLSSFQKLWYQLYTPELKLGYKFY
jgi:hypothetical protein